MGGRLGADQRPSLCYGTKPCRSASETLDGIFCFSLHSAKAKACKCEVYTDLDWIVDGDTVVRPDVMIVCGEPVEKYLEYPPRWIVEILSQSTAFRDQIVKKELYAEQGVKYYLIADPNNKIISVFELIDGEYQTKPDDKFDLTDYCAITLDMEAIMAA